MSLCAGAFLLCEKQRRVIEMIDEGDHPADAQHSSDGADSEANDPVKTEPAGGAFGKQLHVDDL